MSYLNYLEKIQEAHFVTKSPKCNCLCLTNPTVVGVFVHQLPDDQMKDFKTWLWGQTTITICGQPFAYGTDYNCWYDTWINDKMATIID